MLAFFFTVDVIPFRTRYFSESRKGHTPLHGRAYYQMMECLGVGFLFSPSELTADITMGCLTICSAVTNDKTMY
jgi:hypothetical protein